LSFYDIYVIAVNYIYVDTVKRIYVVYIGLPASGKTTWAKEFLKNEILRGKRHTLLSTDEILSQMKVLNLRRKRNFKNRFEILMKNASGMTS